MSSRSTTYAWKSSATIQGMNKPKESLFSQKSPKVLLSKVVQKRKTSDRGEAKNDFFKYSFLNRFNINNGCSSNSHPSQSSLSRHDFLHIGVHFKDSQIKKCWCWQKLFRKYKYVKLIKDKILFESCSFTLERYNQVLFWLTNMYSWHSSFLALYILATPFPKSCFDIPEQDLQLEYFFSLFV